MIHCPSCSNSSHQPFIEVCDRQVPRDEVFKYLQCDFCDLVYMSPMPDADKISSFYQKDYSPFQANNLEDLRLKRPVNRFLIKYYYGVGQHKKASPLRPVASILRFFAMRDTLKPHGKNTLLDVGCGLGGFLYRHREMGWKVQGIEFSNEVAKLAQSKGLDVSSGTLADFKADQKFDIITFRHVLEHLPNPLDDLKVAKKLLNINGKIIIELPNLGSYGYRRYKKCWFPLEVPRHLLLFNAISLKKLIARAGLNILTIRSKASPELLEESQHLEATLGQEFSSPPAEKRKSMIAASLLNRKRNKKFIRLRRYPSKFLAWAGLGENLYAELSL